MYLQSYSYTAGHRPTRTMCLELSYCTDAMCLKQVADGTVYNWLARRRVNWDPGDQRALRDGTNERQSVRRGWITRGPRTLHHDDHQSTTTGPSLWFRLRRVPIAYQPALWM